MPGARVAVLVLPGGGFREHTLLDGIGYAHWLNRIGISATVLHYRLRPAPFPLALRQARAVLGALQEDPRWGCTDATVRAMGSSAGGLLAGLLATGAVLSVEDAPAHVPRPAFQAQCYGLADLGLIPESAVEALLGDKVHLATELSPVTHVDERTAPTFAWTTAQDPPGLPNALAWARVLGGGTVCRWSCTSTPRGGTGWVWPMGWRTGSTGIRRFPTRRSGPGRSSGGWRTWCWASEGSRPGGVECSLWTDLGRACSFTCSISGLHWYDSVY